ncbi:hypothetical protein K4L44_14575 [Halosquirtibacter laminarini]|uniref:Uncharacterized protein n=1 Tax=Halosquirtibacter laminarini TaxID=3374600 RepID=A0AC61NHN8_9BACT|nr:hypothetical protein K4L44_14575 [Prolixibacteraceae bacterium]
MKYFPLLLFLLFSLYGTAQNKISGHLFCEKSNDLFGIVVTMHPDSLSKKTLAYCVSDEKGDFKLSYKGEVDHQVLRFRSLAFHDTLVAIASPVKPLNIQMYLEKMDIEEVNVRGEPVVQYGDTTSFLASSFVQRKDFSIADAIKRMPGLEVTGDGEVLYQGAPIEKFYVEGLDLMGKGYGTVTKNLPHKSVSSVQVLHNHQTMKMMEDKVTTNATSLNIKLKRAVTVTGSGSVGMGYKPLSHYLNLTPMTFTKKYQMVNSFQMNNIGDRLEKQADMESAARGGTGSVSRYHSKLNIPSYAVPMISESRYLDNNDYYASANGLYNLKNGSVLKINGKFLDSEIQSEKASQTKYMLDNNPYRINESFQSTQKRRMGNLNLTLSRNLKSMYLENVLGYVQYWDKGSSTITSDSVQTLSLSTPHKSVYNLLHIAIPIGDSFLDFNSTIDLDETSESLSFEPTVFQDLLQDQSNLSVARQEVYTRSAKMSAQVKFGHKKSRMLYEGVVGASLNADWSSTDMYSHQAKIDAFGYSNDLNTKNANGYLMPRFTYEHKGIKLMFSSPIYRKWISIDDRIYEGSLDKQLWLWSPLLSSDLQLGSFTTMIASLQEQRSINSPNGLLKGNIVYSHRSMQSNQSDLYKKRSRNYRLEFKYDQPLKGYNAYIRGYYNHRFNDYISDIDQRSPGVFSSKMVAKENEPILWGGSSEFGYYWLGQQTNIAVGADFLAQTNYYLSQNELRQSDFSTATVNFQLGIGKWTGIGLDYIGKYTIGVQEMMGAKSTFRQQNHKGTVSFYPSDNQWFTGIVEYTTLDSEGHPFQQALFTDIIYTWSPKGRFRFSLNVNNLFDVKSFDTVQQSDYYTGTTSYQLRPRCFILKISASMGRSGK